jgi:PTS system ascorbate-specific IIA component
MNRILIIAHAPLAHALRQCALHVFPDCEADLAALDVQPNMPPEESLGAARIVLAQLTDDPAVKGVLVLTDIFGATPCNMAQKLVDGSRSRIRVLAGTLYLRERPKSPRTARPRNSTN